MLRGQNTTMDSTLQEELQELKCLKDLAAEYGESEDSKWFKRKMKELKQKYMSKGGGGAKPGPKPTGPSRPRTFVGLRCRP